VLKIVRFPDGESAGSDTPLQEGKSRLKKFKLAARCGMRYQRTRIRRIAMPTRKQVYHSKDLSPPKKKKPVVTVAEAFGDDEVVCMICGQRGMKTLARHLNFIHNLKPGQYRKLFGLKSTQLLTSKNYSIYRKKLNKEIGSIDSLPKAREARLARLLGQNEPERARTVNTVSVAKKRVYRRLHVFEKGDS
jgi:predicted transcriptional regulator